MAQDNTIPLGKPGIASFESETYGNAAELLFGDTPPVASQVAAVEAGANLDLPLGAVVNIADDGEITLAQWIAAAGEVPAHSNATHILAAPLVLANTEETTVPVYVAGHFRQQALTFHASFNTDALKQAAFKGTDTPMILISKAKYVDDNFPA